MAAHRPPEGGHLDRSFFVIDRDLPVALGTQLRGLIEFGIGLGTLRPGDRLPSVRQLADQLGLAAMTVAQVYRQMTRAGMLVSRRGSGTFVAELVEPLALPAHDMALHRAIDGLILQGRSLGLRPSDLVGLLSARAACNDRGAAGRRVMLVGHFATTTAAYCAAVRSLVGDGIDIEPATLDELRDRPETRRLAAAADLVITLPHRRAEVMELLPRTAVAAVTFIPSSETRQKLAALDPGARVAVVSIFPEFASIMKAGVRRFAPHIIQPTVVLYDAPERDRTLRRVDVVVFATGADDLGLTLPRGVRAFEYRHTPDPADVRRLLLPLIDEGRPHVLKRVS